MGRRPPARPPLLFTPSAAAASVLVCTGSCTQTATCMLLAPLLLPPPHLQIPGFQSKCATRAEVDAEAFAMFNRPAGLPDGCVEVTTGGGWGRGH